MALPQTPDLEYLLLKSQVFLRWAPVLLDITNNPTAVTSYNIYQGINGSPENMELFASVGSRDLSGAVDTMWTGPYSGFSVFGVSAVNSSGESQIASMAAMPSPNDPDI